ncbi:MAG: triose-phosphate isomerase [Planctomycetes bacterium]|nr:triose-phosphate isomerase [Planctomycetota bacterium]
MRRKIIAGNWKMNLNRAESTELIKNISSQMPMDTNVEVICIPPFVYLQSAVDVAHFSNMKIGAQDVCTSDNGAFTGDVSAKMLADLGCKFVIVGHSERRQFHDENSPTLVEKIVQVLKNRMTPIICVGETLKTREEEDFLAYVRNQLREIVEQFTDNKSFWENLIIAYEPIWAIGTGKTASEVQAQEMCENLRNYLEEFIGSNVDFLEGSHAQEVSLLYGGSVKPANAGILSAQKDIDGFLVGGASLKTESFLGIINKSNT